MSRSRHNEFILQQTMYRIKDPSKTIYFYSNLLGMTLLKRLDFKDLQFSLLFFGYVDPDELKGLSEDEKTILLCRQKGCLEFTYNWNSEKDDKLTFHNGNTEPRGYGHIGIVVPDTYKISKELESQGVEFYKKPDEGQIKGIAFLKDPDGYYIELLDCKNLLKIEKTHCNSKTNEV